MIIDTILKIMLVLIVALLGLTIVAVIVWVVFADTQTGQEIDERIANRIRRNRRD